MVVDDLAGLEDRAPRQLAHVVEMAVSRHLLANWTFCFVCLFACLFVSIVGGTNSQNFVEKESTHELHPVIYFRTDLAAVGGVVGEKPPISQYLPSEVVDGDFGSRALGATLND